MRCCSIFSQLLQLFPRHPFQTLVQQTQAERHARGFSCWEQFVTMLFCQLAQAASLREVCGSLASYRGKWCHLRLPHAPAPSTLAYANAHRSVALYEQVFYQLLQRCEHEAHHQGLRQGRKLRFKHRLVSVDATTIELCATTIELCASVFDWAKFRRTKGAVKIHLVLAHQGYLPAFVVVTEGRQHEITVARTLTFEAGTIVVADRGYSDYEWFASLTEQGVYFVTRLKANAVFEVLEARRVPTQRGVLADQVIRLSGVGAAAKCPHPLRRVEIQDAKTGKVLVFLTNHLGFGATTIAAIYRERWQIETFFKQLKQHLKIKSFVGTTANALKIQVWTAMIALLLLRYLQFKSRFTGAFAHLVSVLRLHLFSQCKLWQWLATLYPTTAPP